MGCAIVMTGILGIFFPPLWIVTIVLIVLMICGVGGQPQQVVVMMPTTSGQLVPVPQAKKGLSTGAAVFLLIVCGLIFLVIRGMRDPERNSKQAEEAQRLEEQRRAIEEQKKREAPSRK